MLFAGAFRALAGAGLPPLVLDGEMAVPDERGVTHIDALTEAMRLRRGEEFAYFAFDLLHDLPACAIEDRKSLRATSSAPRTDRVSSGSIMSSAEVRCSSRRCASAAAKGSSQSAPAVLIAAASCRNWQKTKVSEEGGFAISGYIEHEAVAVAELRNGVLVSAGLVKFGLAGKGLWRLLDPLRDGPSTRSGTVPVQPELVAGVKFFGRYRGG